MSGFYSQQEELTSSTPNNKSVSFGEDIWVIRSQTWLLTWVMFQTNSTGSTPPHTHTHFVPPHLPPCSSLTRKDRPSFQTTGELNRALKSADLPTSQILIYWNIYRNTAKEFTAPLYSSPPLHSLNHHTVSFHSVPVNARCGNVLWPGHVRVKQLL